MNNRKSVLSKMMEQHKKLTESLALSMPEIDVSILESMKSIQSSTALSGFNTTIESLALSMPEIDSSIMNSITDMQSLSGFNTTIESLALSMTKIDSSIMKSIIDMQSSTALSGINAAMESLAFSIPKIDVSILESMKSIQSSTALSGFNTTIESLALSMPEIDSSIMNSITDMQSLSGFNTTIESLALSMTKIDSSIMKSIIDMQSSTALSGLNAAMESLAFSIPKIDTYMFEQLKVMNIDLKSIEIEETYNIEISEQDIHDIEILSAKIDNKINLTYNELYKYLKFLYFFMEKFIVFYTIYTIFYPNNQISIQLKEMEKAYKKQTEKIIKNVKDIKIENDKEYYEVTKQVRVRTFPNCSKESKIIDIALKKQKLLIINKKPYWIQIEYFNEEKQETVIGWISKKYTKRLTNEL